MSHIFQTKPRRSPITWHALMTFFVAITIAVQVAAQEKTEQQQIMYDSLEDVVVSNRVPTISQNRGQSVILIDREKIRSLPVSTIDELLRYLPGLDMQQRGMFGAQSDISARGSTFNQNLVVINGIPANDPLTGHFNANFLINPGDIERIEIVRGPSSLAYGSSGVGVTIHIYTYGFDMDIADTAEFSGSARLSFGSYEQQDMAFAGRYNFNNAYLGGSIWSYNHVGPQREDSSNRFLMIKQYAVHSGGRISDRMRIAVRGLISESEFDARYFYTASPADRSIEKLDRYKGEAAVFIDVSTNLRTDLRYGYLQTRDRFAFTPLAVNRHDSRLHTFQINNRYSKGRSSVAFGVQGMSGVLFSNDRGNRTSTYGDIYGIVNHLIGSTGVSYGIRLRLDDAMQLNYMPQVWVNQYRGKLMIRGGLGVATRTPTYTERYVSTGLPQLAPGRNLGNPDLRDELAVNAEIGTDWNPAKGIKLSVTGWARSGRDIIDYAYTRGSEIPDAVNVTDTGYYFYARNFGRMNNVGGELTLNHYGKGWSGIGWNYTLGYSANHLLSSAGIEPGKYLLITSRNLVNFNGVLSWKWYRISSTLLFKERRQPENTTNLVTPSAHYLIWNPAVGVVLPGGYVELSARNIMNTPYTDIAGVSQPGRWYMLSIKVRI